MNSGGWWIQPLGKDNYDTWKMQMEAVLVKNDGWSYVNGEVGKPTETMGNSEYETEVQTWVKNDQKAKSDIILAIKPSELKCVKGCVTSREVWLKLESIHQSKEIVRKTMLLKQLLLRLEDGSDVLEHVRNYFRTAGKLSEMDININGDLLAIMLLNSLPSNFERFRRDIESRELPSPEVLWIKIIEESHVQKTEVI